MYDNKDILYLESIDTILDLIVNEIIKKERIDIVQNEYFEQLYMVYAIPNTVKKDIHAAESDVP